MARLLFTLPDGQPKIQILGETTTIGRVPGNTVVLPSDRVSKAHASIVRRGDGFLLIDQHSTNGTFRNGNRVVEEEPLADGDELAFGDIPARFRSQDTDMVLAPPPAPEAGPPAGGPPGTPAVPGAQPERSQEGGRKTFGPMTVSLSAQKIGAEIRKKLQWEDSRFLPADQIAGEEMLRRDYEKLRIAHELLKSVNQEVELEKILARILDCCFSMLPADRGVILLYNEQGVPEPRVVKHRESAHDRDLIIPSSILRMVEQERAGLLFFDAAQDMRLGGAQSIVSQGIRSALAVPLIHDSRLLGLILIDSLLATGAFSEKDLHLLSAIAGQAALFVDHADLMKRHEEEAVARARFQRMFSPEVAAMVASGKTELKKGGVMKTATVLFADIRGFTALSEPLGAEDLVDLLNQYFERMVDVVFQFHGTLDKFVGDAIMAVFGAPIDRPDDPFRAVQAGLGMLAALEEFNRELKGAGKPPLSIGIGINSGEVAAGYIGSSKALQYTVIGAQVNLASRLCSRARDEITIVISESTWASVKDRVRTRELEPVPLKGISHPVRSFQVLGVS